MFDESIISQDGVSSGVSEIDSGIRLVINNHPLSYISQDSDECLTPAHLIFRRSVFMSPPLNQFADDELPYEENINLRDQYSKLTWILTKFKNSWHNDFLIALRECHYT